MKMSNTFFKKPGEVKLQGMKFHNPLKMYEGVKTVQQVADYTLEKRIQQFRGNSKSKPTESLWGWQRSGNYTTPVITRHI
jgi:hypothetical protein